MQKQKRELPVLVDGDEIVTRTFPVLTDDEGDWVTLETAVEWEEEHRKLAAEAKRVAGSRRALARNPDD